MSGDLDPSETVHTTSGDQHDPKAEPSGEIPPTSVFVNSEPMREEQVQNAVKFLSHPFTPESERIPGHLQAIFS
ncbi:hypothetical protein U1Q18_010879 [Sarracenia purpurea var. burkii]